VNSESGQGVVDYVLILAGVALVAVTTLSFMSGRIHGLVSSTSHSSAFAPPTAVQTAGEDESANNRTVLMLALPAVALYHAAHGGWAGMSYPRLQALDDRIEPIVVVYADATGYCITNTGNEQLWYQSSASGLTQTPCTAP
jgi:hypothetical protein